MTLGQHIPLTKTLLCKVISITAVAWSVWGSPASPSFAAEDLEIVINRSPIIVAGTTGESFQGPESAKRQLKISQEVHVGDLITTKPGSFAEILFQKTALLTLHGGSEITVTGRRSIQVIQGEAELAVGRGHSEKAEAFELEIGRGLHSIVLTTNNGLIRTSNLATGRELAVIEGAIQVYSPGQDGKPDSYTKGANLLLPNSSSQVRLHNSLVDTHAFERPVRAAAHHVGFTQAGLTEVIKAHAQNAGNILDGRRDQIEQVLASLQHSPGSKPSTGERPSQPTNPDGSKSDGPPNNSPENRTPGPYQGPMSNNSPGPIERQVQKWLNMVGINLGLIDGKNSLPLSTINDTPLDLKISQGKALPFADTRLATELAANFVSVEKSSGTVPRSVPPIQQPPVQGSDPTITTFNKTQFFKLITENHDIFNRTQSTQIR